MRSPLLARGSIGGDILRLVEEPPYDEIFAQERKKLRALELMNKVEVVPEVVQVLEFFQRNDAYTYRHKLMVFALSTLLSQELISDSRDLLREVTAGPCHDFGKINVPLAVLKKRDPLTAREKKTLEHHTLAGYVLLAYYLRDADSLAARIARDHHERRDGSGYPLGAKQESRLVEIVAVSDIYDALISPRPYRPESYDNRSALEELTAVAERGVIGWDVLTLLVALNRHDKPDYADCRVSVEKRGGPPAGNVYGITVPDGNPAGYRPSAGAWSW